MKTYTKSILSIFLLTVISTSCKKQNEDNTIQTYDLKGIQAFESNPVKYINYFKKKLNEPNKSEETSYSVEEAEWLVEAVINYDNPIDQFSYPDTLISIQFESELNSYNTITDSKLGEIYTQTVNEISTKLNYGSEFVGLDLKLSQTNNTLTISGLLMGARVPGPGTPYSNLFGNTSWKPQYGKCNGESPSTSTPLQIELGVENQFPLELGDYFTDIQTIYINTSDIISPSFNDAQRLYLGPINYCITHSEMVGYYNKSFSIINHYKPGQKTFRNWLVLFDYSGTGSTVLWFYHITYGNKHNIYDPIL